MGRFNIFRRGHFYVGAGVLWLPNAEVIVDNGVLRTAASVGLSRIWVEIYGGGKMGGRVEKLERCKGVRRWKRRWLGEGGLPWLIAAKVRSRRKERGGRESKKKKEMALSSCRKSSGIERVKKLTHP